MKESFKNMCEGHPLKLIFLFSLPLMLGNMFQQMYTMADTMIVSKKLGVTALAALGCCDWLNWAGFGIVTGFSQGFSILVAQRSGAQDEERRSQAIFCMLVHCAIVAVVLVMVSVPLLSTILRWLDTPPEAYAMSLEYATIIFCGLPITMFYNAMASLLRALGNSKTPLYAMVVASLLNVGLDVLFVLVYDGRIVGAAVATLLAQLAAGMFCLIALRRAGSFLPKRTYSMHGIQREMYRVATPMALQNVLIAIGGIVLTGVVNQYGEWFVAGFTAVNKLYGILEVAAVSYGYAMVAYIGQNYGAGRYDRIISGLKAAALLSLVTAVIISIILFVAGPTMLSWFVEPDAEGYAVVMDVAWKYLRAMALFLPILYILHVYRSTLQGLSDTVIPMLSGFLELATRISMALVLSYYFGQDGVYFAEVLAWLAAVLILVPSYYWHEHKLKQQLADA